MHFVTIVLQSGFNETSCPSCRQPVKEKDLTPITEKIANSSTRNNRQPVTAKAVCDNCTDCRRGAVRGSYFRGQLGGVF
ncbi:unnamed protein product [Rotaria magnacalcarata]|uniref:Uncharacterized protein n=2 Tax=Rotaria magnacalcarata TaxID=392030 RepID=A0A816PAT3_9BILA|nr:unnamed protein product [Rotaria magnacalcarata]CAF3798254.1 unnamed protein product [Rotaria magnacalcarata]